MNDPLNDGRTKIIDIPSSRSNVKRRRRPRGDDRKHAQSNMKTSDAKQFPIEMTPVIEAVREYARRTHSLGALQGAHALQNLASEIRKVMPSNDTMLSLADMADAEAKILKEFIARVYEDS
ncbi:MAG: hypothetical protein WCT07_03575 [Candidatus Paceibacterota bacterium]